MPTVNSARQGHWREGLRDLVAGCRRWRVSYLLGVGEIRRRYARSRLGQFWVSLTTAFTIVALGFVWSQLWRMSISEMMPFVTVSLVAWAYISGILTEGPVAFVAAAPVMHNQGIEPSVVIYGLMLKHLAILGHNIPVVVVMSLAFGVKLHISNLGAFLGLALLTVFLFGLGYFLAIVCLRFRDLAQVIVNIVNILFFVTPVLWQPSQVPAGHAYLLYINPFAVYLATIRKPLLGEWPTQLEWGIAVGMAMLVAILVIPLAGWASRRLIFWI